MHTQHGPLGDRCSYTTFPDKSLQKETHATGLNNQNSAQEPTSQTEEAAATTKATKSDSSSHDGAPCPQRQPVLILFPCSFRFRELPSPSAPGPSRWAWDSLFAESPQSRLLTRRGGASAPVCTWLPTAERIELCRFPEEGEPPALRPTVYQYRSPQAAAGARLFSSHLGVQLQACRLGTPHPVDKRRPFSLQLETA